MMVKPWAKAIAAIPGRPTPSPTTAAAPAPMNTNEKVPMNSARSFGAIRLDIVDSRDEIDCSARSGLRQGTMCWIERPAARDMGPPAGEASALLRGDRLRREIDADRLGDAGAVFGIGSVAVDDLPLDDLDRHALHRCLVVLKELLLLAGRHEPEQVARLTIIVVAVAVILAVGVARDLQRRLPHAPPPQRALHPSPPLTHTPLG